MSASIHVIIERIDIGGAAKMARDVYDLIVSQGKHVILDTPWNFETNLPERRLSSADVIVTARQPSSLTK